jgi:hypothetical protein
MPSAFETLVCDECKGVDFDFESARAPLRYTSVGKEIVHSLKYRGYTRVVEKLIAPLMLSVLDNQDRFDAVVHRAGATAPLAAHAQGVQSGRAPRAGPGQRDTITCFGYNTRRA